MPDYIEIFTKFILILYQFEVDNKSFFVLLPTPFCNNVSLCIRIIIWPAKRQIHIS
jgi:hypothetical protein